MIKQLHLIPLFMVVVLCSCNGAKNSFNRQKYTKLSKIETKNEQQDAIEFKEAVFNEQEFDASYEEIASVEQYSDFDELLVVENVSSNQEDNFQAFSEIEIGTVVEVEQPTDSTTSTLDDNLKTKLDNHPDAIAGKSFFFISLGFLVILIIGSFLAFTSFNAIGGLLIFLSVIIGYPILCGAKLKLGRAKKWAASAGVEWTTEFKVLNGLALAGVIGFGLGFLPLMLFALAAAIGWY